MDCIDVYYSPKQVSCPDSSSPSPSKPALVVADWVAQGLPIRIVEPVPASRAQIALAHAPAYVDGILNCELMNGFRGRQNEVAESLPGTWGSLLSAASAALSNGLAACSPTSGFHHAGYSSAFGFCTFNGLMETALALKAEGKVRRVGILDCDQHYGDGTAEIMAALQSAFLWRGTWPGAIRSQWPVCWKSTATPWRRALRNTVPDQRGFTFDPGICGDLFSLN